MREPTTTLPIPRITMHAEPNVTPSLDVPLVLLIIFMYLYLNQQKALMTRLRAVYTAEGAGQIPSDLRPQPPMHLPFQLRQSAFDHAIQQLRDGRAGESGYGRRIALVLTIPTYDDPVARDIRRSASGELYVVRTIWQRAIDLASARPSRPVIVGGRMVAVGVDLETNRAPSLVSSRVHVDAAALEALLESVSSSTVTCHVRQPDPPLDATIYEVTFGDELNETRYRWTDQPPEGWSALGAFTQRLLRLIDEPTGVGRR